MRGVSATALLCAVAAAAGCGGSPPPPSAEDAYLGDATARRAALEASLVNPSNGYSALRLAHYASGTPDDWDLLPEWNPAVGPVAVAELDVPGGAQLSAVTGAALATGVDPHDHAALLALGEAAYFSYPIQLAPAAAVAVTSRAAANRYGLWLDDSRGAGGLVRVGFKDGTASFAFTCATCHASTLGGASLVVGVGSETLNLGALFADGAASPVDPALASALLSWGPGRVDVTTHDASEPVRIPDLRPVRWLGQLHHDATVVQRDVVSLAIRLETLIITSNGQTLRPPRIVALALAEYVWSLADALSVRPPASDDEARGESLFASSCATCHAPPRFTGAPVPLAEVGTDPHEGESKDRGTGAYRVPSLRGISTRPLLLHDASLAGLGPMFDPARPTPSFSGGTRAGAVPGHVFGLALPDADRAALLAYLRTL